MPRKYNVFYLYKSIVFRNYVDNERVEKSFLITKISLEIKNKVLTKLGKMLVRDFRSVYPAIRTNIEIYSLGLWTLDSII